MYRVKTHLEPLAIAANVAQAAYTRLDHVLLMLANLVRIYSTAQIDNSVRAVILASIERRWKSQSQDAYILAVLFNPYIRARCFNYEALTRNEIVLMAKKMFHQLFSVESDPAFSSAVFDYMEGVGEFSDEAMMLQDRKKGFTQRNEDADLVSIWRRIDRSEAPVCTGRNGVVKLARRLLSVIANSAGCERTFSTFGNIHTKIRNRLSPQNVHKTTLVKMDIRRSHAEAGISYGNRLKRKFGTHEPEPVPSDEVPTPSSTANDDSDEDLDADYGDFHAQLIADAADAEIEDDLTTEFRADHGQPRTSRTNTTRTCICLSDLFKFPTSDEDLDPLDFYWKGGISNLEDELAKYDIT